MEAPEIAEFAVRGDTGLDIFHRVDARSERRYHYECLATVLPEGDSPRLMPYHPIARRHPERMFAAARRFGENPALMQAMALGDPASYPHPQDARARLEVFLYLDFLRLWQVGELEIARMRSNLQTGASVRPADISRLLRLLLDYNQIHAAAGFIPAMRPHLFQAAQTGRDDKWGNAAYALRMMGDLYARAGQQAEALAAYEGAISLGDNAHRRGLAIRAAHAAGNLAALQEHLTQYESKWSLPDDLAQLNPAIMPIATKEGSHGTDTTRELR
ncbi:MAG: hypothetical protein LAT78_01735 [Roseinatronobacter sp.]|nr:hypothetical protein [Roseinatronobacter sp.]